MNTSLHLPEIKTDRLLIRSRGAADAAALLHYQVRNKEHLASTQPDLAKDYYTVEYWRKAVAKAADDFADDRAYCFTVSPAEEPTLIIGVANYSQVFRGSFQACYLGYALDHDYTGRGIMTEALTATNAYMFEVQNIHRIMANYLPDNIASARVLAKLNFVIEGRAQDYLRINGAWREHVLTSLTNEKWRVAP